MVTVVNVALDGFAVIDQLYASPTGAVAVFETVVVLLAQSVVPPPTEIEPVGNMYSGVDTVVCTRTQPDGVVSVTTTVPVPAAP